MATRRRVSNPLALAVLALLLEQETMHPYEMSRTMRERGKEGSIRLNYGSLYAVVEKLVRHGLIETASTERAGARPERTTYRITPAGRDEFEDWLAELLSTPEKEYPQFEAGLALLPGLPPAEVARLLETRCQRLELEVRAGELKLAEARELKLARLFMIESEYAVELQRAELDWTRALLADIRTGSLDGIEAWRSFHGLARGGDPAP